METPRSNSNQMKVNLKCVTTLRHSAGCKISLPGCAAATKSAALYTTVCNAGGRRRPGLEGSLQNSGNAAIREEVIPQRMLSKSLLYQEDKCDGVAKQ